jgi:hypothetical protein
MSPSSAALARLGLVLALATVILLSLGSNASPASAAGPPPTIPPPSERWVTVAPDGQPLVHLYFGWTSTCPHCAKARPFIASLQEELPWLVVHSYQLDGPDGQANAGVLVALADELGETINGVPAFFYDARLETGFDEAATTGERLRAGLIGVHDAALPDRAASPRPTAPPAETVTVPLAGELRLDGLALPAVVVVLAGLDAVNPCALSVLLFLLGVLVGVGDRRRMLLVGATFVAVSGVVYFAFMSAWLNLFLLVGAIGLVTLLAGLAAIAAGLVNVKDYGWFGQGPSLVIPQSARPGLFGRMLDLPERVGLPALLAATAAVAAVANLYEALCTGGFPVVFTRILTLHGLAPAEAHLWIAAYCTVYVLPLLAIVALFTWRTRTHTVSIIEARRLKLLSGLLMLGLGLLLVVAPDRLSDLTATLAVFGLAVGAWALILLVRPLPATPASPEAPARSAGAASSHSRRRQRRGTNVAH